MTSSHDPALPERAAMSQSAKTVIFISLMCCTFLAMLDSQIVATAMPSIMADLGEIEKFSWIGSAYLITHSAVMPICGKLGDLFGRKYVLVASVVLFVVASLGCGLAGSTNWLIAARFVQGAGAGGIIVSVFAAMADIFAPRERARYQSFASLVLLLSASIGPFLGGILTQYLGWRWIFLVNLPIGIFALLFLIWVLPNSRPTRKPVIDYAGAALVLALVSLLVIWGDSPQLFGGLFAPMGLGVLAAIAALGTAFVLVERRAPEPVLSMSILTHPTVLRLLVISVGSGAVGIGMVNYHALYLQNTTGLAPAQTGTFFIILMTGVACGSMLTGRLISRSGNYKPVLAVGLLGAGVSLLLLAMLGHALPLWGLGLLYGALGVFGGLGQQVPTLAAQMHVAKSDIGAATGAVSLFRVTGAAVAGAVYGSLLHARLPDAVLTLTAEPLAAAYQTAFIALFGSAGLVLLICAALAASLPKARM